MEDHIEETWTFCRSSVQACAIEEVVMVRFIKSPQPSGPSLAPLWACAYHGASSRGTYAEGISHSGRLLERLGGAWV